MIKTKNKPRTGVPTSICKKMAEYPPSLNSDTLNAFLDRRPFSVIHLNAKWDAYGFMLQRRIQEIAAVKSHSTGFGFIDVDDHPEDARSLRVLNVPACAYYRGREHVTTITGLNQDVEANLDALARGEIPDGSARIELDYRKQETQNKHWRTNGL
jgi:hypothetical protein